MRPSLGIIGLGAFGEFSLKYLLPYFQIGICDKFRDLDEVAKQYNVQIESLEQAAKRDIVVLATPVANLQDVCKQIKPLLTKETILIDVSSVKVQTLKIIQSELNDCCEIVSVHPLFGPQSGKNGIAGLCLALIEESSARKKCVKEFCENQLNLDVVTISAENHDREVAYIQGITHLFSNVFVRINPSKTLLSTATYDLLEKSVDLVRHDSIELLRAIETENPYVSEAKFKFFTAVRDLENMLTNKTNKK